MFWADQIGLDVILAAVEKYHASVGGEQWKPASLLKQLVADGRKLGDL
jgi:3-hydroxyacyl-CoA dehydrogenase